jgi:transcription elongation factor GreA
MYHLTKDGHAQYEKELADLQKKRPEVVVELSRASELGDRSENAAYRVAKSQLGRLDSRIRFLDKMLRRSRIITPKDTGIASIGSQVKLRGGKGEMSYRLVDSIQSNLAHGDLSIRSPLGLAILHGKAGSEVTVSTPRGIQKYTILNVSVDPV